MGPGAKLALAMALAYVPTLVFWVIPQAIRDWKESKEKAPRTAQGWGQ